MRCLLFFVPFLLLPIHSSLHAQEVGDRVVVAAERASIKVGSDVLATCKQGDILKVTAVRAGWLGVEKDGNAGWLKKAEVVRYEAAEPVFDALVRQSPDRKSALVSRASFLVSLGKISLAIDDYTEGFAHCERRRGHFKCQRLCLANCGLSMTKPCMTSTAPSNWIPRTTFL